MPVREIAAALGVSHDFLNKALKFYEIPKRPPLNSGNCLEKMRKLRIGESAEIEYRDEEHIRILYRSAERLGIIITIDSAGEGGTLRITRISADETRRLSKIAGIDRTRLENLYIGRKLSTSECAWAFGGDRELIRQALTFYGIARRPAPNLGGKYATVFRELPVGETTELECSAKYPHNNLHTIAVRVGVKISMRKIGENRYRVTKLK